MYAQCKSCHVVCLVNPLCLIPLQLMEFLRSKHPTMAQVLEVVLGDIGTLTRPCLFINRLCMCESVCARACVCVCARVCVCVCVCVFVCARCFAVLHRLVCAWLRDTAEHSELTVLSTCEDQSVEMQPLASDASLKHPLRLCLQSS